MKHLAFLIKISHYLFMFFIYRILIFFIFEEYLKRLYFKNKFFISFDLRMFFILLEKKANHTKLKLLFTQ